MNTMTTINPTFAQRLDLWFFDTDHMLQVGAIVAGVVVLAVSAWSNLKAEDKDLRHAIDRCTGVREMAREVTAGGNALRNGELLVVRRECLAHMDNAQALVQQRAVLVDGDR